VDRMDRSRHGRIGKRLRSHDDAHHQPYDAVGKRRSAAGGVHE
jgi:hypothetical protein